MTTQTPTPRILWARFLGPVLAIALLAWAAIHLLSRPGTLSQPAGPPVPGEYAKTPLKVGATLPDLVLKAVDGKTVSLSSLGKEVVLINFWASWCPPCLVELPSLVRLREAYHSKGFEVVGINIDENPNEMIPRFQKEKGLTFPLFYDPDQKISDALDVQALPLTVIVDRDRKVLYFESGERDWNAKEVRARLDAWLGE